MAHVAGRSVIEVRRFCVVAAENEEVEIRFSRDTTTSTPCQVFFLHKDILPEECHLEAAEDTIRHAPMVSKYWELTEGVLRWVAKGLSPGILNVVTVHESSDPGVFITSATPVPVLPREAAEEMCDVFERTLQQETKSDLLLSKDRSLSEMQKSAIREAIWCDHIRSFAVDLDFLLTDMDEENEPDDETHEDMCDSLLKVFRNLYEFLKKSKAHNTIQYLIQACKEQGVISFYSQYHREEESSRNDAQIALYEMAPKFPNTLSLEDEDDANDNNDTSEFYQNFAVRTGSPVESSEASFHSMDEIPSMEQLCGFPSFEAFSRAGSFRSRTDEEEPPMLPPLIPPSPTSQDQPEEVCWATP